MFLRPELVKENLIRDAAPLQGEKWLSGEKRVGIYRRFATMTAHGNMGTPTAASKEKGRRIFDAVVRDVVAFVKEFAEWPLPTQLGPKN
jgi:creatinine amidohydrolase/Fe(II)-dependent formamide hydrolase-like protein